jgi:hypothetical protein
MASSSRPKPTKRRVKKKKKKKNMAPSALSPHVKRSSGWK